MNEKFNKYSESLYLYCENNEMQQPKKKNNCSCEGLIAKDNTTEILIQQLKKEVAELMKTTQAQLLCQDKKIAKLENYIKTNLSNYLRILFDSMVQSGEIEQIIKNIIGEINLTQLEEIENIKTDLSKVTSDLEIAKNDISMNIDNIRDNQSAIAKIKENH